ncbi:MAG: HEAT repeat domain-containing protein [Phycisphaerae bacterium]|nr:HEAT repeat domain-containing protein [Phycisphaerae bacterium]
MWDRKIERLLKRTPDIAAPDGLLEELEAEIELPEIRRQEATKSHLRGAAGRSRATKLAAAAVIVAGVVGGMVYLLGRGAGAARQSEESMAPEAVRGSASHAAVRKDEQAVAKENAVIVPERTVAKGGPAGKGESDRSRTRATMGVVRVDTERIEAERIAVREMAALGDIDGLMEMLSGGMFAGKVAAAEHLGEIGDERALPLLKRLNKMHGGWLFGTMCVYCYYEDSRTSGAFAVAICKIMTRDLPADEQVEAWFDVLEGRGPVMPTVDQLFGLNGAGPLVRAKGRDLSKELPMQEFTSGSDVGRRVAAELSLFDDPSVVARLRQTENKGAAPTAVWMEVRDMEIEEGIERCKEIARNEAGAQQYGVIRCLAKFGEQAIYALDELAGEGYPEAISTFDLLGNNMEVFDILCRHLTNNKHSQVRLKVISPALLKSVHFFRYRHPLFMQPLITALYDPNEDVRRRAAVLLRNAAYQEKSRLIEHEEELLMALKHPDEWIRPYIAQALGQLGSTRMDEKVADPPQIRTDLEE